MGFSNIISDWTFDEEETVFEGPNKEFRITLAARNTEKTTSGNIGNYSKCPFSLNLVDFFMIMINLIKNHFL